MISCDAHTLSKFLDGDLDQSQYRDVAEHLKRCTSCRKELAELRRVDAAIWSWGARRVPVPPETEARVHHSLERRRKLGPLLTLSRMMPAALGTSVAALLVLVTVNLSPFYNGHVRPSPDTPRPVSSKSLKQQSAPLLYARGKSAVVSTHTVEHAVPMVDRVRQLNIY